jgi:hypothetical protein
VPPARLLLPLLGLAVAGCSGEGTIEVDLTEIPPRFIVDHHGWPRPFWWPRVTEFAIGSEKDDLLWHVQAVSSRGELTHRLAFVYGRVPPGFTQLYPENGVPPKPLKTGRSYYVGATGPKAAYRVVFALPESAYVRPSPRGAGRRTPARRQP